MPGYIEGMCRLEEISDRVAPEPGLLPLQGINPAAEPITASRAYVPAGEEFLTQDQDCLQCGRCCERWGWGQKGIVEDIIPWIIQNRQDILQHVSVWFTDGQRVSGSDVARDDLPRIARIRYWQDPDGREMRRCPFFWRSDDDRSWCRIHDVKPRVCREFTPWTWKNLEYYGNCPACREKAP